MRRDADWIQDESPTRDFTIGDAAIRDTKSWRTALLAAASEPYRKAGRFAYFFARGKYRRDPIYLALLERGLLVNRAHVLDLGCGQGLLAAWLLAAERMHGHGHWPHAWPPPPRPRAVRGIELMPRDVERANRAFGSDVDIAVGDIRDMEFGAPDAVVILDVLHYLSAVEQRDVLVHARRSLPANGLLLLRVSDADGGLPYRYAQWVDRIAMRLRGHAGISPHWRSVAAWRRLLLDCGFDSEPVPMSRGTPFANVLLVAHAR